MDLTFPAKKILTFLDEKNNRNIAWSLGGNIAPLIVGLVFIPLLIEEMGVELFGFLTIIWMVIGYFTLFDFGISRALTYLLSRRLGEGRGHENNQVFSTAAPIVFVLGVVAGIVLFLLAPWLSRDVFIISESNATEAALALQMTAIAVPFTIWAVMLRACLESYGEFKAVNVVKLPIGIWMFVGPYVFMAATSSFAMAVMSLLLVRVILFVFYWGFNSKHLEWRLKEFHRDIAEELMSFGGWMTVSNIISPVMVYFDRFFIGALIAMSAVAFYTTPYEVVTKILILPGALMSVFFPLFAEKMSSQDFAGLRSAIRKFRMLVTLGVGLPCAVLILFGGWGLEWWLGAEFREQGYWVLVWLSCGVFFNSIAQVYFTVVQSAGKSKWTAIAHLMEAPLYVIALFTVLAQGFGVAAVAFIWMLRVLVDMGLMKYMAGKSICMNKGS